MKGNLFLILQYVSVLNAEGFFKHDTAGMCYTIYPRDDEEKSCIKIGVNCFNCPFIYSLNESSLYKVVGEYK